jgi:phosphoenolpyruvate synthase/pyruvate phosphate dikinase
LGGEGANLAEMTILGSVPPGFTTTTIACREFLSAGSEPGALASRSPWRCGEILDRLLHHCDIFAINGPGHRRRNRVDLSNSAFASSARAVQRRRARCSHRTVRREFLQGRVLGT